MHLNWYRNSGPNASLQAGRAGLYSWVLVLALLWAQSLGLWHGIVHGGRALGRVHESLILADAASDAPPAASGASRPLNFFESLFGNHHEGVDCELFDQLCHGDALVSALVLAIALVVPAAHIAHLTGLAAVRWTALFHARAPPFFR